MVLLTTKVVTSQQENQQIISKLRMAQQQRQFFTKFGNFFRNSCALAFISAKCGGPDEISARPRRSQDF